MGTQYVVPSQLPSYGLNPYALQKISQDEQQAACVSASSMMDDYFAGRYPLPFLTWPISITTHAAHIAVWLLLSNRGRNPEAGYDDQIDLRYEQAIEYCKGVQRQSIHPAVTFSAPTPPAYSMPAIRSRRPRGWWRS